MIKRILLVIPYFKKDKFSGNPGGQATAALGLVNFLSKDKIVFKVIDTTESSFPSPNIGRKLLKASKRLSKSLLLLLFGRVSSVIIFSSIGPSLIDRLIICLMTKIFKKKSILFLRETFSPEQENWGRKLLSFSFLWPSLFLVQGSNASKQLFELGIAAKRIKIVPNWRAPKLNVASVPKTPKNPSKIRFVFVGWLVEAKGVRVLVEALEQLRSRGLDFEVCFVGGGTLEDELKKKFADPSWSGKVHVLGWKNSSEVHQELEKSDVFVLPTLYREGFPNALLEAMCFGLPAICTAQGSITDSLKDGENGFIVALEDSVTLAECMQRYIENPELVTKHSKKTLEVARERHDPEKNIQKILDLLS